MAFLYKYLDAERIPRYVGIVKGETIEQLDNRIYQHTLDGGFERSWTVYFVRDLSLSDADLLETYYVRKWADSLINKAKRSDGALSVDLSSEHTLVWEPYEPGFSRRRTQRLGQKASKRRRRVTVPEFPPLPCRRCKKRDSLNKYVQIEIDYYKKPTSCSLAGQSIYGIYLCPECYDAFFSEHEKFFYAPVLREQNQPVIFAEDYSNYSAPCTKCHSDTNWIANVKIDYPKGWMCINCCTQCALRYERCLEMFLGPRVYNFEGSVRL
ncbi:MAG: hypothetical protein IJI06_09720 [Oscillospiraceae bacterium]|nr:hypothetical protein [Oscillospiraceae bacterium]